jgi:hypothetical protein
MVLIRKRAEAVAETLSGRNEARESLSRVHEKA